MVVSRAVNFQSCEFIRGELSSTLENTHKAFVRLNDYISNLKSEKIYKKVELYLDELNNLHTTANTTSSTSSSNNSSSSGSGSGGVGSFFSSTPKLRPKRNSSSHSAERKEKESPKEKATIAAKQSPTLLSKSKTTSNLNNKSKIDEENYKEDMSSICHSFIQNRLYMNKAMMNVIEPYLIKIKIQDILSDLYEKVDLDKEILLVFTHLKKEEQHLSSFEALQPLFKRYALGYERCIQIWRKKCYADNLIINNFTKLNTADFDPDEYEDLNEVLPNRNILAGSNLALDRIQSINDKHKQYSTFNNNNYGSLRSNRTVTSGTGASTLINNQDNGSQSILNSNFTLNLLNNIFDEMNGQNNNKNQRYFSGKFRFKCIYESKSYE